MDKPDPDTLPYDVGKWKPPEEHKFKAGQPSANVYGRKGKPENRERIAAKKAAKRAQNTAAAALRRAAERLRRVTTSEGAVKIMTTLDLTAERIASAGAAGDVNAGFKFLAMIHDHDRQARAETTAQRAEEREPTCGVAVIPSACATLEETLADVRLQDSRLKLQDEVSALEQIVAEGALPRRREPLPAREPDRREVRAYGGGAAPAGPRDGPSPSPPTPGRSQKADGRYR